MYKLKNPYEISLYITNTINNYKQYINIYKLKNLYFY